jgi:hypothetical protein
VLNIRFIYVRFRQIVFYKYCKVISYKLARVTYYIFIFKLCLKYFNFYKLTNSLYFIIRIDKFTMNIISLFTKYSNGNFENIVCYLLY